MPEIVTVTLNPAIDVTTHVDHVIPERKLRCTRPERYPGGGGLNVARAIHRLGGAAHALWSSGGLRGELLRELLDRESVPHTAIPIGDDIRENLIVCEDASGQQYRFDMPGPEVTAKEADAWIAAVDRLAPPPDYLVLSGSLPPGVADAFYGDMVRRMPPGCRVILDTAGGAIPAALDAGVYLWKPNLRELAHIVSRQLRDDADIEAAARWVVGRGRCEVVIVSVGRGGALVVTAEGRARIHAPTVRIDSKVGAGDSMVAGVVLSLSRGAEMVDAACFGVAAGAAAVMTPGTELCRREDTERLYHGMTERAGNAAGRGELWQDVTSPTGH